jgi:hypothetical protein
MSSFTWGGHNLHDEAGIPTMFADAVIFTEAIPHTIVDDLARQTTKQRAARAARHTKLRLTGHRVIVCREQPDLVLVVRRRLFKIKGRSYTKYVDGIRRVTPNRGTFVVSAEHRPTGQPVAFVGEHRINAAFRPWIRGEREFRQAAWKRHTDGTWNTITRLKDSGYLVPAGGDLNTPHGIPGYPVWMTERGEGFDRLGLAGNGHMGPARLLSRKGSDHPRIVAEIRLP